MFKDKHLVVENSNKEEIIFDIKIFAIGVCRLTTADIEPWLHTSVRSYFYLILSGNILLQTEEAIIFCPKYKTGFRFRKFLSKIIDVCDKPACIIKLYFGFKRPWYYLIDGNLIEYNFYKKFSRNIVSE